MESSKETVRSIVFSDIMELKGQLSGKIRPFECELCRKKFVLASDLEKHLKIHYVELKTEQLNPMDCLKFQLKIPPEQEFDCNDSLTNQSKSLKVPVSKIGRPIETSIPSCKNVGLDLTMQRRNKVDIREYNTIVLHKPIKTEIVKNGIDVTEINSSGLKFSGSHIEMDRLFSCLKCDSVFETDGELQKHSKKHREKPYACDICHKRFLCSFSLKYHLKTHSDDIKNYTCTMCDQGFRTVRELNAHMKAHMEDKPFACDTCEKRFTFESDLKRHLRTHTGEKNHICDTCNKRFSESSKLKRHLMSHTETKPFVCEICSKLFSQNASLKRHLVTHTGEKNFTCQICERSFADISTLRRHLKSHSEEKPFDCEHCEKKFKSARTLRNHVSSAHSINNVFACDPCGVRFVDFNLFKDHLKAHRVELTCMECKECFSNDSIYKEHLKSHMEVLK